MERPGIHIWGMVFFFILNGINFLPDLYGQEIDLDSLINDSTRSGIDNLNASINSGLSNSLIQVVHTLKPWQVNISFNKVSIQVAEKNRSGSLSNTRSFSFPVMQMEIGLPQRIHLIGRGMAFEIGENSRETALLWGVGARYTMFQDTSNVRAGILVLYEALNRIDDFDIQSLVVQGYIGVRVPYATFYIAPVAIRSTFNIHLNAEEDSAPLYQESRIESFLKLSLGTHLHLTKQISLAGNVVLGEYTAIGLGGNILLF